MLNTVVQSTVHVPSDIVNLIYASRDANPNAQCRSNVGGWQSKTCNSFRDVWIKPLLVNCLHALNITDLHLYQYWFNISPPGAYHNWHTHGAQGRAMVCYIKVPRHGGGIEFRYDNKTRLVEPSTGSVVAFAPNLEHRVLENQSNEDRISVAFNLSNTLDS